MLKRFHLPRILGLLAAITCTCVTLAVAAQVTPSKQKETRDASGLIVLDATPSGENDAHNTDKGTLPPVTFDHSRHTKNDKNGETCANCHEVSGAVTAQTFAPVAGKAASEREDAFHAGCVSCHAESKSKGMRSGPLQAECRACHNAASLPGSGTPVKADGGLDASLHARHINSPLITAPGSDDNCAACHHQVKKPLSPTLKADSCRSCHPAAPSTAAGKEGEPSPTPFSAAAHKKCISCHQDLAASGTQTALTCAACHDAGTKAGYPKLSPVPRLPAGQPDTVLMPPDQEEASMPPVPPSLKGVVPDAALEAATSPKPSMPPVVFDHKRHETATDSCVSCHHNTLQSCSSCHTPLGSPKGNNVPQAIAMHLQTSPYSCVGCHEARKTAAPECASCHGAMSPKAGKPECASCHTPLESSKLTPAGHGAPDSSAFPDGVEAKPAPGKTVSAPDLSSVPEKIAIGALSDRYEPALFPHKAIIENLASGIEKTAPGMMRFHATPNTLCASCHHNSPPSATPPPCASCHPKSLDAKKGASSNGAPVLKTAYHQQCMSCHTRMGIEKPANTDCAGCHSPRPSSGKTEGGK